MNAPASERAALETIHEVKPDTFIFEKKGALPLDICNEMIRRFEASKDEQYEGRIGQTVGKDRSIKHTTDVFTSGKEKWKDLDRELFRSLSTAIMALPGSPFTKMGSPLP